MNKYRNTITQTTRGKFASKKEANQEQELFYRLKAKEIEHYDCQIPFRIEVNGQLICKYIADFVVSHNDGSFEIIETKGYFTALARLKMKLMQAIYGEKYKITIKTN